ncbi:XRE family transcriptional regulator [Leisingera sp. NJS201]|uniref:helix-turn-helix domain-containing protein n=1 Tax=Leisingera sp. NJS201 TaxID=2508306 RepID=UPI001070A830|nr:helix-turn-helix transcriptional regulator [Leisingera sp. NJS201]QBR36062.1 XRE family transcriptional regulator [Leisingera sp. NJS201]
MTDFKEKIRHVRDVLQLSRRAMGELLDIPEGKVQKIEIGGQRADHEFLSRLLEETEVDLNWLLDNRQPALEGVVPTGTSEVKFSDADRLRLAIEAVEEGLDAFDRQASPKIKASLIAAAYELLEQEGEGATAQIIRLVRMA